MAVFRILFVGGKNKNYCPAGRSGFMNSDTSGTIHQTHCGSFLGPLEDIIVGLGQQHEQPCQKNHQTLVKLLHGRILHIWVVGGIRIKLALLCSHLST